MNDQLLTVPEAAKYLRISKSQLYLLVQRKKIPYVRLTEKRIVIRESELQKWIEKNTIK
jgi:excisionase family DNA binding protein